MEYEVFKKRLTLAKKISQFTEAAHDKMVPIDNDLLLTATEGMSLIEGKRRH